MAGSTVPETSSLQELVQRKESEWREAQELRNNSLQAALQEKDRQLNNEKLRFRKLKDDFEYNLKLLEERDHELGRYDALFSQFRQANSARDGEISDLKIQLDEFKLKLSCQEKANEELQRHYQQRLREHQQELNQFRLQKESELRKEREEIETFKRELQTQLRAAEEDVEAQRQELMAGFDDALRKREHEFRKKTDDLSNKLLASELRVKMLTKELELLRASDDRVKDELETTESIVHSLEKQLKQKEWEMTDEKNTNTAKVAELEAQIEQLKTAMNKLQERYQYKHAELDRYAKEKEQALTAAKQAHGEHERSLEEKIHSLENKLETEQVECRRLQWACKDTEKEKELEAQRLQGIIADQKVKLDKQTSEHARTTVARDLELEALRQQEEKMRMEIAQHKESIDRYKKELTLVLERESSLERSKVQLEVDWQRRCEDTEREVYSKQEQLIASLTKARDEARALALERERELLQRDDLIQMLTQTKDQAVVTLKRHGLSIPTELPSKENTAKLSLDTETVKDMRNLPPEKQNEMLEQQNANLREVIQQMRQDMEDLNNQLASRPPSVMVQSRESLDGNSVPLTKEYIESLEKEIKELKSLNRSLKRQIEVSQSAKPPLQLRNVTKTPQGPQPHDPFIQAHIKELNGTIGALRQEKLELSAQVKKQQATMDHLQGLVNSAYEEVRQKQLALDQLQYEVTVQGRRASEQQSALQQRVTDLELQLAQTRTEADEYFKSGLERNAEATSLGNQLSTLKVELASQWMGAPSFNPQATVVKQLQDEIQHLKRKLMSGLEPESRLFVDPVLPGKTEFQEVSRLRLKLRAAVQRISGLAHEKEQLIQMGNRLRAELSRYSGGRTSAPPGPIFIEPSEPHLIPAPDEKSRSNKTPAEMKDHFQGQLSAVEKLQYQLTSHELQFAKRMAQKQAAEQVKVTVVSSSSESTEEAKLPDSETAPHKQVSRDSDSKVKGPSNEHVNEHVTRQSTNQRSSSPLESQSLFTSSSEGHASLQEIWKMLDQEESFRSPSPFTNRPKSSTQPETSKVSMPDHIPAHDPHEGEVFTLEGKRADVEKKPTTQRPVLSRKAAGKAKSTPKKLKVRNYNIKDDT